MSDLVVYNDGELELNVSVNEDTIWLTQKQIAELFEVTVPNINMHIKAIYKEEELFENRTIQKYLIVQQEGKREVKREIEHYNLDVIISVGYRVNSIKATKFRQWATSVLKSYMTDGYVINTEKITNQRFRELENDITVLKMKVENISNSLEDQSIKTKSGIFYDGQMFDAYAFVSDIIKSAKNSIVLIDNYVDESVLLLLSKRVQKCEATIYTKNISKQLELDLKKYNSQYPAIEIKKFDLSHDRFLIIDENEFYHIGASLKDLGNKWFGFSKMDKETFEMIGRLK
ncbi:MAG: virulence RhuM family protein [Campylobacterales bacterium]|nr:virulence RhuM family protein [Campylobacterales bacterium]